jgi:hypothetical protein
MAALRVNYGLLARDTAAILHVLVMKSWHLIGVDGISMSETERLLVLPKFFNLSARS